MSDKPEIEIIDPDNPPEVADVPLEDAEVFRGLRSLALQSISVLVIEADELQGKIKESQTKPKKDLYTKKFNKVKEKFQDEIARLVQIEHTMKENNIPFDPPEDEQPKKAEQVDQEEGSAW